jgi:glycosyltransferase involved in cell wall biosynthesis
MAHEGLSVLIPTKNEADHIGRCLESVTGIADEIVVLDSFSDDGTAEICREHGAKVIQKEFQGFAQLRRELLDVAQEDWILFVDADEIVTEQLAAEINEKIQNNEEGVYKVNMNVNLFGEWVKEIGGNPIRFGLQTGITVKDSIVHEEIIPTTAYENQVKHLNGVLQHNSYTSVSEYINKFNQYTALEALKLKESDEKLTFTRMFAKGIAIALYYLTIKRGISAGTAGILFASMSFQYRLVTYFKYEELNKTCDKYPESWRDRWIREECRR